MPDLAKTIRQEIARIAKRESKKLLSVQASTVRDLKSAVSVLKHQVAGLEKARKPVEKALARVQSQSVQEPQPDKQADKWFTGRGVRALRKRLRMTQAQFARLAGVSDQAVVRWEGKAKKLRLQNKALQALASIRAMGRREALEKLGVRKAAPGGAVRQPAGKSYTGKDVMALRKRLGLTQAQLAKRLGVSQKGVSQWESKKGLLNLQPKNSKALANLDK